MKRNILYYFSPKCLLPVLLVLGMLLSTFPAYAETSAGAKPEASSESDTQSLHVGDTHEWKPFVKYPQLQVTYRSNDPEVLRISADGLLTALKERIPVTLEIDITPQQAKMVWDEVLSLEYIAFHYTDEELKDPKMRREQQQAEEYYRSFALLEDVMREAM